MAFLQAGGSNSQNYPIRVSAASIGVEDDDDDDDMNDDCDDSFGEDGDDEMMDGGSELTTQLAAAGWQHGVVFCFVLTFYN